MELVYYVWPEGKRDEGIFLTREGFMRVFSATESQMEPVEEDGKMLTANGYEGWAEEA